MKLLVADDHEIVRKGLRQILAERFPQAVIDEVGSAAEIVSRIGYTKYDVILVDISMPGRSGLDAVRDIRSLSPDSRILVLSIFPEHQYAIRAIKLGAHGYLNKSTASEQLVRAVEKLVQGGRFITPEIAEQLAEKIGEDQPGRPYDILSDRELEITKMLAGGKTPTQIADELAISVKTVSTLRERILQKLNLKTTADIIRFAILEKLVD